MEHWYANQKDTYSSESSQSCSCKSRNNLWQQVQQSAQADAIESKAKQIHNMCRQRHAQELDQHVEAQLRQIVNNHDFNYNGGIHPLTAMSLN